MSQLEITKILRVWKVVIRNQVLTETELPRVVHLYDQARPPTEFWNRWRKHEAVPVPVEKR